MTGQIAARAWQLFQAIEAGGGLMASLMDGTVQAMIDETRSARDADIARRKIALTGVSEFPDLAEASAATLDMPVPDGWRIGTPWQGASVSAAPLAQHRLADPFEDLRADADARLDQAGSRPAVFLATLGTPADFNVRTTWMSNLLAAGGIDTVTGPADALAASGLSIACLCSSDDVYAADAEQAARALKAQGAREILLAGRPGALEDALRSAGVDRFVHAGQDVLALLSALHQATAA